MRYILVLYCILFVFVKHFVTVYCDGDPEPQIRNVQFPISTPSNSGFSSTTPNPFNGRTGANFDDLYSGPNGINNQLPTSTPAGSYL